MKKSADKHSQFDELEMTSKTDQNEIEIDNPITIVMNESDLTSRKKYGKMIVLLETDNVLLTLGPDYVCFLLTFVLFIVAGYFLISVVNEAFENIFLKIGNITMVIIQIISYLMIAISNPGIILAANPPTISPQESITRFCKKCKWQMVKGSYHCSICDVCIRGYDHHCPWTSKCIGACNLKRFYFFVGFTPLYLVYFMVLFMIGSAVIATRAHQK